MSRSFLNSGTLIVLILQPQYTELALDKQKVLFYMIIQRSLGFSHVGKITQATGTALSIEQSGDICSS
jgi:hypothetical protein